MSERAFLVCLRECECRLRPRHGVEHGATGDTEQSSKGRDGRSARKREGTDRHGEEWEAVRRGRGPGPT